MTRLDAALVASGLARSRARAREAVAAGRARVDGAVVRKPSADVPAGARLEVDAADAHVSRAAGKLIGALDDAAVAVPQRVLDAGASTGGFTQVLLERGAGRVYAVDVGHGQLDGSLRADPRVVVWERTNLRDLTIDHVEGAPVQLAVGDVSFISLRLVLEPILSVLDDAGAALLLVKPQFEVGRSGLDSRGVVRSARLRQEAVDGVVERAAELGWGCSWRGPSRLAGGTGNIEWFVKLERGVCQPPTASRVEA
ncbi:MAG: TlyA family RNA methyltransferase [Propionibacteriaceae bacterium]|nr:TlyA family RNA methyltransferase [Propionibacteriaceae bacterium]